mgnify:CR=1 FL=1|jgi:hypothetical protein
MTKFQLIFHPIYEGNHTCDYEDLIHVALDLQWSRINFAEAD